jgi:hypothetical protein
MRAKPELLLTLGLFGSILLCSHSAASASVALPTRATVGGTSELLRVELALDERTGRQTRLNRPRKLRSITKSGMDGLNERVPAIIQRCRSQRRLWRQWEGLRRAGGYQPWKERRRNAACG